MTRLRVSLVAASALIAAILASIAAAPAYVAAPAGSFVWHDLVTDSPGASRTFYGSLFGWTFEAGQGVDPGYTIVRQNGRPIGGIVVPREQANGAVAQWLSYVVVSDVDRAAAAFRQAGGRVFRGPLSARKDLRVAVVADAQGATLGLASRGPKLDPEPEMPPAVNRWLWMEYVARDADGALDFFDTALGYRRELYETRRDVPYFLLLTADRPRAGLFRSPWQRETSVWLPYVRVSDPAAMAAKAAELGGTIALAPRASVRNGSVAIVLDPAGAPLALQKYPFDGGATP